MRSVVALAVLLLHAGALPAQVLRGTVTDLVSGEPVVSATILVVNPDSTVRTGAVSDRRGVFALRPAPGSFQLRVQRSGYVTTGSRPLDMTRSDTLTFEIRLAPKPVEIDSLVVVAAPTPDTDPSGFFARRKQGWGKYLGPEDVARRRPTVVSELLHDIAGFTIQHRRGTHRVLMSGRGRACLPTVYLNRSLVSRGSSTNQRQPARIEDGLSLDELVNVRIVQAVEIYREPGSAPPGFHSMQETGQVGPGDCGVIVLWTRNGLGL